MLGGQKAVNFKIDNAVVCVKKDGWAGDRMRKGRMRGGGRMVFMKWEGK